MAGTGWRKESAEQRRGRTRIVILVLTLVVLMIAMNLQKEQEETGTAGTGVPGAHTTAAPTPKPTPTPTPTPAVPEPDPAGGGGTITLESIPAYDGQPYVVIGDNIPDFPAADRTTTTFESYSELDALGRCGEAYACVGVETMPTDERESIYSVKPSGWQSVKYDFIDGESLYNRCHLIGFQLTGENANEENLITGTRYMNVVGMLPFEDEVAGYVKKTQGHVLYRVTPVYDGDDLVASGVRMEGWSVEDEGASVCFDVYCYNYQPGVEINYADGTNQRNEADPVFEGEVRDYVLNTGSRKFHYPKCSGAASISEKKRKEYTGTREMLIVQGYAPCGECRP